MSIGNIYKNCVILTGLFFASFSISAADYYFEAEDASGTPNFSPFSVLSDDPLASGGQYVMNTGADLSTPSDSATGQMHFNFTVNSTCNVSFFVRCGGRQEWAGYNNSLHYKIEGLDTAWTTNNDLNRVNFDWHYFGVRTAVPAGSYTLKILRYEDGTKLDAFFVNFFTEPLLRNEPGFLRVPESGHISRLTEIWPSRYVEAEEYLGNSVFSPLSVLTDSTASGGKCITYASGATDDTPADADTGQAWYAFNLDTEKNVDVWVRAKLVGVDNDSFWYKLKGADASWIKLESANTDWCWYKLGTYTNLARGTRILKLLKCEDGVLVDRLFFSIDGSQPQGARSYYIEAEAKENTTNFSPLVIKSDDSLSSGHGYIMYGSGPADTTPDDADTGQANYTIRVQQHNVTLDVWANVLLPTADDDLFYFRLDGKETGWNTHTGVQAAWGWKKLNSYAVTDAGVYTFKLLKGEDGAKIDRLYICTDGSTPAAHFSGSLGASARFIAPTVGSDLNNGTAAAPWKTLQYAFSHLGSSQQLYIRGGVYYETDVLHLTQNGTESQWCEVKAYPGEEVIIDGSGLTYSETRDAYGFVHFAGSYLRVEGLKFRKSRHVGVSVSFTPGEIINCRVDDCWSTGIFWGGDGVGILNNIVVRPCSKLMDPGEALVNEKPDHEAIHGSGDNFEIAYNVVCFGDKEGIDTLGGMHGRIHHNEMHHLFNFPYTGGIYCDAWNPIEDLEIYNNWIHDQGSGIGINSEVSQAINNLRIHHNTIENTYWNGIDVSNYGDLENQTTNIGIWNNTLVNCQFAVNVSTATNLAGQPNVYGVNVRNNLFAGNRQDMLKGDATLSGITAAYNLYYGTKYGIQGTNYQTGDPKFVNRTYGDYHLLSGSAAINTGDPAAKYNDPDLTRNDIGAYSTGTPSAALPAQASGPYPADGAVGRGIDESISWVPASNVEWHRLFFGNDVSPLEKVLLEWNVFSYGESLLPNTVYFWKVDEENATGTRSGNLWSFKTEALPDLIVINGGMSEPFLRNNGTSGSQEKNEPGWYYNWSKTDDRVRWNRDLTNSRAFCDDIGSGGMVQVIHNQYAVTGSQKFRMKVKNTEGDGTVNLVKAYVWGINGDFSVSTWDTNGPKWNDVSVGTKLLETANQGGTTYDWNTREWTINLGSGYDWIAIELWTQNVTPTAGDLFFVDDVEITGVNHTPSFNTIPMTGTVALAGASYSASITGSAADLDGDTLNYSKASGPAWLTVASNGALSGTPGGGDLGLNTFIIEVDDGRSKWDQNWLRIEVTNGGVPLPPYFITDPISKPDAAVETPYSGTLTFDAADPNPGDTLTFTKLSGPAWLMVAANGDLSGTPAVGDIGMNNFTVEVSDGVTGSDTAALTIEVVSGVTNNPPSFTSDPIVKANATADTAYSASIASNATDPDAGDTLTFSRISGPAWLTVAANGTLNGMPAGSDAGLNSFTVQVDDGNGGTDTAVLNITVIVPASGGITVCGSGPALAGVSGQNTASFTATNTGPAGNYLIIAATSETSHVTSMTFNGSPMTQLYEYLSTGMVEFYGIATSSLSGTVNVTYSGTIYGTQIYGYAFLDGVDTASPLRATAGGVNASGTGSLTVNYSAAAVSGDFAMLASNKNNQGNTCSVLPVDTTLYTGNAGASFSGLAAYDAALANGTYSSTFTFTVGTAREVAGGVILKALPAPFVPNPDITGEGDVNLLDFERLASAWLNSPCAEPAWCDDADIDHSGAVTIDDLEWMAGSWLQ